MNKLVRGRIKDGAWVDQQTIWEADVETYTSQSDIAAGGRTAFDDQGHVFISIGIKAMYDHLGIQDLGMPYGKIHRVRDDGSLPAAAPRDWPSTRNASSCGPRRWVHAAAMS